MANDLVWENPQSPAWQTRQNLLGMIDKIPSPSEQLKGQMMVGGGPAAYAVMSAPDMIKETLRSATRLATSFGIYRDTGIPADTRQEVAMDALNVAGLVAPQGKLAAEAGQLAGRAITKDVVAKFMEDSAGNFGSRLRGPADVAAKSSARMMEKQGKSAAEILDTTGFQRDAKGNWVFEIDDSVAKFNFPSFDSGTPVNRAGAITQDLEDTLQNPELYSAYPELKGAPVTMYHTPGARNEDVSAVFQNPIAGAKSTITNLQHPGMIEIYADFKNPEQAAIIRRTLMHEVQHSTQAMDNISAGKVIRSGGTSLSEETKWDKHMGSAVVKLFDKAHDLGIEVPKGIQDALAQWDKTPLSARYNKNAGEVEARNTERRLTMTAAERRKSLASKTEDVFRSDQLDTEMLFNRISEPGILTQGLAAKGLK